MIDYIMSQLQDLNATKSEKGKSAQDLAILSNIYGLNHANEYNQQDASDLAQQNHIEDRTQKTQKAEWRSAMDFFSGFFFWEDKVEFSVNDVEFSGRNGYQVRGGEVPVFDGAVIDFIPATLEGKYNDEKNMNAFGKNAQLVVYPKNMNYIFSIMLDDFVDVGLQENSPYVKGKSNQSVSITNTMENGDQMTIQAAGASFEKAAQMPFESMQINLLQPVIEENAETQSNDSETHLENMQQAKKDKGTPKVAISNEGVLIDYESTEPVVNTVEPSDAGQPADTIELLDTDTQAIDGREIHFTVNGTRFDGKEGGTVTGGKISPFAGVNIDFSPAFLEGIMNGTAESTGAVGKNAILEMIPQNTENAYKITINGRVEIGILNNKPYVNGESTDSISLQGTEPGNEDERILADGVSFLMNEGGQLEDITFIFKNAKIESEDKSTLEEVTGENGTKQIQTAKSLQNAIVTVSKDGIHITTNETKKNGEFEIWELPTEGEETEDEEDDEEEKSTLDKVKDFWGDEAKWDKLKFLWDAFNMFVTTGKVPDPVNTPFGDLSEMETEGDTDIGWSYPILPGLNCRIGFEPAYEFKLAGKYFFEDAEDSQKPMTQAADEIKAILLNTDEKKTKETQEEKKDRELAQIIKLIDGMKIRVGGGLMLQGSLSLTFYAGLQVDASYLFEANACLSAKGELKGMEDTGLASADLSTTIGVENGKIALGDSVSLDLQAGLSLDASIGSDGGIQSRLFDWEKVLWDTEFASLNIATVNMDASFNMPINEGISGLKMVKRGISYQVMKNKMKANNWNNMKINLNDPTPVVSILTKNANAQIEDIDALMIEYENLKRSVLAGDNLGNLSTVGGEESFQLLKDRFVVFAGNLETKMLQAQGLLKSMEDAMSEIQNDSKFQQSLEETRNNIKKHETRLAQMQQWADMNTKNGQGEVTQDNQKAFEQYKRISGGKAAGMVSEQKKEITNEAKKKVGSRDKLLFYEASRQMELQRGQNQLIDDLNGYISEKNITDMNQKNPEFVRFYLEKTKSDLLNYISLYNRDKQSVLDYEKGRKAEKTKKHTERIKKIKQKLVQLGVTEDTISQPNAAFLTYYEKELGGKQMLSHLMERTTIKTLIAYEESKLTGTKTGKYYETIKELERQKKLYLEAPEKTQDETIKTKQKITEEAREYFYKREKIEEVTKNSYKMATTKDVIDYEEAWKADSSRKRKQSANAATKFHAVHDLISLDEKSAVVDKSDVSSNRDALLQDLSATGKKRLENVIAANHINAKDAMKIYKKEEAEKVVKENVSLDTILEFLKNKRSEKEKEKQKTKGKKQISKCEEQIKYYGKIIEYLQLHIAEANRITDPMLRQQAIEEIRKNYFEGLIGNGIDGISNLNQEKDNEELVNQITSGKKVDAFVLHEALLAKYNTFYGAHEERAAKLREFEEGDDMRAWDAYKKMEGGERFKKEWVASHKNQMNQVTIDQMMLYEKRKLRKASREGWLSIQKKKIVNSLNKNVDVDEVMKGGHYQRVVTLLEWQDQQFKVGETEEEHNQEVLRRYREELLGGNGYESYLEAHKAEMITPEDVLNYENDRSTELGKKHADRITLLESFEGETLTPEQMKEYRSKAMSDGEGVKDKVNSFLSQINKNYSTGYDASLNPEEALTPQMIMDYESDHLRDIGAKHEERINLLMDREKTDDQIWEEYQKLGGGKRFAKENSDEIDSERKNVAEDFYSFERITNYEKQRKEHYDAIMEFINKPIKDINSKKDELASKITSLQGTKNELSTIMPEQVLGKENKLDKSAEALKNQAQEAKTAIPTEQETDKYREDFKKQVSALEQVLKEEDLEAMA